MLTYLMHYVKVVLQTYFSSSLATLVASLNLGDEEGPTRSVDQEPRQFARVLGYVSIHAWGLRTEDARIFFKFKRSLCVPVFLEI